MAQQPNKRPTSRTNRSGSSAGRSGSSAGRTSASGGRASAPAGRGGRPEQSAGQRSANRSGRKAPAHAAPAHASTAPRRPAARKRSAWPAVIAVLALVFVGLLVFFVLRSCGSNNASSQDQQAVETDVAQQAALEEASPDTNADGSVDINLMMVGDILFHYQVRMSGLQSSGARNYDHVYAHVLDELEGQDIKVLNQETPLGGQVYTGNAPDGYDGYPEFNGPQEMADAEVKAGFNVALKATNHAMDNAAQFEDPYTLVKSEQSYWHTNYPEMTILGQADPTDSTTSADDVYVFEKDGFKVALLNYTQDLNGNEGFDSLGIVSMLDEDHVHTTMAKARELADMIVVFPHWGEEYSLQPVDMQYEWAQIFVDEGADVIIGNHPHVMEPATVLDGPNGKKVPCYWSTGNFISTSPSDESLIGGMAKLTLHKDADGECSVTSAVLKPLVTHLGLSTDMTTYLITDWTDELAATNWLDTDINPSTDNTSLTKAWADNFCTEVLGSSYDAQNGELVLI